MSRAVVNQALAGSTVAQTGYDYACDPAGNIASKLVDHASVGAIMTPCNHNPLNQTTRVGGTAGARKVTAQRPFDRSAERRFGEAGRPRPALTATEGEVRRLMRMSRAVLSFIKIHGAAPPARVDKWERFAVTPYPRAVHLMGWSDAPMAAELFSDRSRHSGFG